jgi:enoyl-CoA hydratase/carnithine racemase
MPPTFGGTQRLPRLAGRKQALELLLTGDPFPLSRALAMGLVNAIVPHDELLPRARDLAQRIAAIRAENAGLRARADALTSDPATIERVARETLGYARPDELVVTAEPSTDPRPALRLPSP